MYGDIGISLPSATNSVRSFDAKGEMYAEDGWIAQYSRYEDYMPQLVDGEWRDPDTS
jgi:hypothetical protein